MSHKVFLLHFCIWHHAQQKVTHLSQISRPAWASSDLPLQELCHPGSTLDSIRKQDGIASETCAALRGTCPVLPTLRQAPCWTCAAMQSHSLEHDLQQVALEGGHH